MRKIIFILFIFTTISYSFDCSKIGNINLENGWNLIGNSYNANFSEFTNNCLGNSNIWIYENGIWSKNISNLKDGQGFWLMVNKDKRVLPSVSSTNYNSNKIEIDENCKKFGETDIKDGWNLLGGYGFYVGDIKKSCSVNQIWTYEYKNWNNNPYYIKDGQGFWININEQEINKPYKFKSMTDENGLANLNEILNFITLSGETLKDLYVEVVDKNANPLKNITIYYEVDTINNSIKIKAEDPNGKYIDLYQYKFSDSIEIVKDDKRFLQSIVGIIRAVMVGIKTYSTLTELFNLDSDVSNRRSELTIFEGTLQNLLNFFDTSSYLDNAIFALMKNLKISTNSISSKSVKKFTRDNLTSSLINYLKDIGGYKNLNSSTQLKANLYNLGASTNDFNEVITLEVIDTQNTKVTNFEEYNLKISIDGNENHEYDPAIFHKNLPDFKGTIIIKSAKFYIETNSDSLHNEKLFEKVVIGIGDKIEVIIKDDDAVFDDDIIDFEFYFDGQDFIKSNELVTIKLDFSKPEDENIKVVQTSSYDLTLNVNGFTNYTYDSGLFSSNPPDFKGTIMISSNNFEMVEKTDSFTNSATFKNVPISIGEIVYVTIIDEDILLHDDIIEFSFEFNEKNYFKENSKAKVEVLFDKN